MPNSYKTAKGFTILVLQLTDCPYCYCKMEVITFSELPGLRLVTNFIDEDTESLLLKQINEGTWDETLSRHVQHFGYAYSYTRNAKGFNKKHAQKVDDVSGHLKDVQKTIEEYLIKEGIVETADLNQCIVNKYERKQGITGHVDNLAFGPVVVSLSLGESCNFLFEHVTDGRKIRVWIPRLSLLILTKEARYDWKHAVPSNIGMFCNEKTYLVDKEFTKVKRHADWRRISVTFRGLEE